MDRRPLNSRSWPAMVRLAAVLAARRVSPNQISLVGMFAGIAAGGLLALTVRTEYEWLVRVEFILAAACIQLRLLCNLIDGMVAVEGRMKSAVGDLYNEVPDRVSDACTIIGAGYAVLSSPTLGFVAAILAVLTAYIRAVGKSLTGVNDYRGPMAKQQRMFVLTVVCLLHALLPVSWTWMMIDSHAFGFIALALAIIAVGAAATCVRRLLHTARLLKERAS